MHMGDFQENNMQKTKRSIAAGILGYLLTEFPDSYLLNLIKAEWFDEPKEKTLFEWTQERAVNNQPVDLVIINTEIPELIKTAVNAIHVYNDSGLMVQQVRFYYVNVMREEWMQREMSRAAIDGNTERMKELSSEKEDLFARNWISPSDVENELLMSIENRMNKGIEMPTGYQKLDEMTDGLHSGELWTIGAYTSVGKTVCLTSMAHRLISRDFPVLYFTSEMPYLEYLKNRLIPVFSDVHSEALRKNKITDDELEKIKLGIKSLSQRPLFICDSSTPNLSDIETITKSIRPGIVFVDHLHRCELPKADNKNEAINEFVRGLKTIARNLKVPIIMAAQFNRSSQSTEEPGLFHLRDSGSIEMESDCVLLLHRDKKKNLFSGLTEYEDIIHANLAKNRHGPCGTFDLNISTREMLLTEAL